MERQGNDAGLDPDTLLGPGGLGAPNGAKRDLGENAGAREVASA